MAHCCPWWLAYTFDNRLRRLVQEPEKLLAPYLRPGMTALDVGCGMGFFSIAMARRVGPEGRVIAVDLQEPMLEVLARRAAKAGVGERLATRLALPDDLRVHEPVDFALAMWMVHEAPDAGRLLGQIAACLRPGARLLVAEPRLHVRRGSFERTLELGRLAGLELGARPRVGLSRAALFAKAG